MTRRAVSSRETPNDVFYVARFGRLLEDQCHPERSEGSCLAARKTPHFVRDDSIDISEVVLETAISYYIGNGRSSECPPAAFTFRRRASDVVAGPWNREEYERSRSASLLRYGRGQGDEHDSAPGQHARNAGPRRCRDEVLPLRLKGLRADLRWRFARCVYRGGPVLRRTGRRSTIEWPRSRLRLRPTAVLSIDGLPMSLPLLTGAVPGNRPVGDLTEMGVQVGEGLELFVAAVVQVIDPDLNRVT